MFSFAAYYYPKSESYQEILVSSAASGILIYLFLVIFQPFGTENFHHQYKYLLLFPYSVIFGSAFLIANFTVMRFKNWNIGAELLKLTVVIFLASIFSYFYNALFLSRVLLSFTNYLYMFLYSLAVGIPISAIYILSRYIYLKNLHEKTAREVSQQLAAHPETPDHKVQASLIISTHKTELRIPADHFICAQSMENYCSLFFIENNEVKKLLIRTTLSGLLHQVQTESIKKCHRSYIVNLDKVKTVRGNAQGYKLFLSEIDFEIPVSRGFISLIIPKPGFSKT